MATSSGRGASTLVLIADDDAELAQEIKDFLERYEFRCLTTATWNETLAAIEHERPHAIILDQWLGEVDTVPRLAELRRLVDVPILILTSNREATDRIVGLELGADDFLSKPISGRELVARIRANLRGRQVPMARTGSPHGGAWSVDLSARKLGRPDGVAVHLTSAECALLTRLMESPSVVLSRGDLTRAVFNRQWRVGDRAIDTLVVNLRLKIDHPITLGESCILTVRNEGYKFVKLPE